MLLSNLQNIIHTICDLMKTIEQLRGIEKEIYREMFKNATPSIDFDKAIKHRDELGSDWYNRCFLSELTQRRIIDLICSKHKLSEFERRQVGCDIRMGTCPSTNKLYKENPYLNNFSRKPKKIRRKKYV